MTSLNIAPSMAQYVPAESVNGQNATQSLNSFFIIAP
jgi:hypothetical protein